MTSLVRRYAREAALAAIIVAMVLAIGLRAPVFLTPGSLVGVATDTAILAMLALAQMCVILTRGIDLSVAANLALTGMIVALLQKAMPELPVAPILLAAVVIGTVLGFVNGALVAFVGIPPIVATLGTLAVYRGLVFVVGGGQWVMSDKMSPAFLDFPRGAVLGVPNLIWTAGLVAAAFALFLGRTRTGRALYAVGGNPVAARYCGIDPARQQLLVFTLSGAVAGLSGYLWVSRFGIAYTDVAVGYELTVIAACVIGGVSIGGGIGSVTGTLLGALFLGVVVNALPVINVSPFWQMAISGAVILAAVVVNARAEKRGGKLILPEARRAAAGGQP
ncbi:ABC transporter permease [Labrys wisconsinensis]|uniref:Rhamnose transport system permease protein n=1 Tax=Labrys wisconsinensis TaxID=425677 RepID=A0ABU0J4N7_9HYPH|nr:ABC transporter permease [Labrys wisconsinensis]MDQ0468239.1 rhamnose transport system permease protein [Labrys wisconsinensis]